MKIVCISDTHEQHYKVNVPDGDVLVHAGDLTYRGDQLAIERSTDWLASLPHKHKVMIAGNHDFGFDPDNHSYVEGIAELMAQKGITYLNDSGCEIDGVKFWGSPITPWFHNWAFNRMRGAEIKEHWNLIPDNTNVLITHGPPYGFGDRPFGKHDRVGCEDLMSVVNRVKPKLHVFGHIHGSAGEQFFNGTHFVNASVVNEIYSVVNSPVVVDLT